MLLMTCSALGGICYRISNYALVKQRIYSTIGNGKDCIYTLQRNMTNHFRVLGKLLSQQIFLIEFKCQWFSFENHTICSVLSISNSLSNVIFIRMSYWQNSYTQSMSYFCCFICKIEAF